LIKEAQENGKKSEDLEPRKKKLLNIIDKFVQKTNKQIEKQKKLL